MGEIKLTIPSEILALVDRLNQELAEIERKATEGINIGRSLFFRFSENVTLIGLFATLSNALLFVETSRIRIRFTVESISQRNVAAEVIQEAGEDLAELLGRTVETKVLVGTVMRRLENLQ